MDKRQNNYCYLSKEGIIFIIHEGEQTAVVINQVGKAVTEIIQKVKSSGKPILILSDITKVGKGNLGARRAGLDLFKNLEYQKLAIVGVNFLNQRLVKAVVTASGVGFKIKLFNTESEAKKWLKS
jgi:hypothetical protein